MGESIIQFLDTWSPIDLVLIAQNFDRFLLGAWVTLQLTVFALVIGGALAIPLAIARTSKNPFINGPVWMFTYTFRGTPLLVQTYLIYYGLGQFEAVRESFLWPVQSHQQLFFQFRVSLSRPATGARTGNPGALSRPYS